MNDTEKLKHFAACCIAAAEGKTIQEHFLEGWKDGPNQKAILSLNPHFADRLRIKPFALPALPEGQEWHMPEYITEQMWADGWRPLLKCERADFNNTEWMVSEGVWNESYSDHKARLPHRTKRPLSEALATLDRPKKRAWSCSADIPSIPFEVREKKAESGEPLRTAIVAVLNDVVWIGNSLHRYTFPALCEEFCKPDGSPLEVEVQP